jgi:putative Mn2+ efflux pump MntP
MNIGSLVLLVSRALDDLAAGVAYGPAAGLPRARWFTVALLFSFFGVLLPVVGILAGRCLIEVLGDAVAYLAGCFLIVTGVRGLGNVFVADEDEGSGESSLSLEPQAVALTAFVVALDTLAVGLALAVVPIRLGIGGSGRRLSYAQVSEWLAERGVLVDQSTIYRWVQRFLPLFGDAARKYREPIGPDWRVDETYARIGGRWHYIYRAIDGHGQIVDAYVSPTRDMVAAHVL